MSHKFYDNLVIKDGLFVNSIVGANEELLPALDKLKNISPLIKIEINDELNREPETITSSQHATNTFYGDVYMMDRLQVKKIDGCKLSLPDGLNLVDSLDSYYIDKNSELQFENTMTYDDIAYRSYLYIDASSKLGANTSSIKITLDLSNFKIIVQDYYTSEVLAEQSLSVEYTLTSKSKDYTWTVENNYIFKYKNSALTLPKTCILHPDPQTYDIKLLINGAFTNSANQGKHLEIETVEFNIPFDKLGDYYYFIINSYFNGTIQVTNTIPFYPPVQETDYGKKLNNTTIDSKYLTNPFFK